MEHAGKGVGASVGKAVGMTYVNDDARGTLSSAITFIRKSSLMALKVTICGTCVYL